MENFKTNYNRKSRKKPVENKLAVYKRFIWIGIFLTIALIIVTGKVAFIQFIEGEELSKKAASQQIKNKLISPERGTIYDCTGEILAQSIAVDTVSINPGAVKYIDNSVVPNDVLAKGFSEIFSLDYGETLEKISGKTNVITIAKKVEAGSIATLKQWMSDNKITSGINIDEDKKRSYPYNSLAANLIGFCGNDNNGLEGIEKKWDSVLTGTSGKIVTTEKANHEQISDNYEQYISAENGSNIYLTLDATVQSIAEKYLEKACIENHCTRGGNVIIMDPTNGDIIAQATYPTYNLNDPFNIEATGQAANWSNMSAQERTNAHYAIWRNRAVADTYESVSTFKLITSAIALEENLVDTSSVLFHCAGKYHVGDRDIYCWRSTPHLAQSLTQALGNSCNPAFMQLGQKIGVSRFYKYLEAFGLTEKTNADLASESNSLLFKQDEVNDVELATLSFGQRFSITPLQLITAISSIVNDGNLVTPRIVKKIENPDTGAITEIDTTHVRQVISKETSEQVKSMMEYVVVKGTGKNAAVEGYSIGGKSGTSEPPVTKPEDGYVASFVAISPVENTKLVVLVILYDPNPNGEGSHQGGQTAAPVAAEILREVLPYLGIASSSNDSTSNSAIATKTLPSVVNKTAAEAKKILENAGFTVEVKIDGDINSELISNQVPKAGTALIEGATIYLYSSSNQASVSVAVPNVKGMSASQAINALKSKGFNVSFTGSTGVVVSQEPGFDTLAEEGTVINLVLKEKLVDGQ